MKLLYLLFFNFLISFIAIGQDCKKLDSKSFFRSIKFGDSIPPDLIACSQKTKVGNGYSFLRIQYDSLDKSCKKKYADLFTFLSTPFSFSQISTNNSGQIMLVEFYSFFEDKRPDKPLTYELSPNFSKIYKKLQSLYGKPTTIKEPTKTDSLFLREKGIPVEMYWICNTIDLQLRGFYGASKKDLNVLHVQIRNRNFDLVPELQEPSDQK